MKEIKVVCGVIYQNNKIFIARRKEGKTMAGKWEFPGGKVEPGESEINALKRELKEELGMLVTVHEKLGYNIHHYDTFKINLIAYTCHFVSATFQLTDHNQYKWVLAEDLKRYDLADADVPILKLI